MRPRRHDRYASHRRYFWALMTCFSVLWLFLAIAPWHREDWFVENILVAIFVVMLLVFRRGLFFSRISYTLIFMFMAERLNFALLDGAQDFGLQEHRQLADFVEK